MKKRKIIFLVLFILFTMYIFSNSLKTATESTVQSGRLIGFLSKFIEFFIQGAFFSGIIFDSFKKDYISLLFIGLLTAVADEFIQNFVPGRGSMVSDCLIDFSGTLTVSLLVFLIWYYRGKRVK